MVEFDAVDFGLGEARVGHAVGEIAIIGQDDKP